MLKTVLCKLADAGMVELVLTTGAVGFLEKHCAPDAVRETADRSASRYSGSTQGL